MAISYHGLRHTWTSVGAIWINANSNSVYTVTLMADPAHVASIYLTEIIAKTNY